MTDQVCPYKDLPTQVKDIQRADGTGKLAWGKYCLDFGGNIRDPSKHDPAFLQAFITDYQQGKIILDATTAAAVETKPTSALADLIKEGQRASPAFKQAWSVYQNYRNAKMNDPALAGKDVLIEFLEFSSQQALNVMYMNGGYSRGGGGVMPPTKRVKTGPVSTGDPVKDALIEKIKQFQRTGEEQRQAWSYFCDEQMGKKRDPACYDNETLQYFLSSSGITASTTTSTWE